MVTNNPALLVVGSAEQGKCYVYPHFPDTLMSRDRFGSPTNKRCSNVAPPQDAYFPKLDIKLPDNFSELNFVLFLINGNIDY